MASKTTILTRHDVTVDGSDMSASMMLDDEGFGHIMVSTSAGPSFSMDASKLPELLQILTEAESIRELIRRDPEPTPASLGFD